MLSGASALLAAKATAAPPPDPLQSWLARHAAPVRTIDAADEDFSDLGPLADAIGQARVVQLGEPGHGAGSCFRAKSRIVKFLHQRLGFDVVIWEAGLYDVALAQAAMCGADDAMTAARRGIFSLWSVAAEVQPLFEYIKASQATVRPLEMAGFDMQVTADGSTARFAEDLRAFVGGLRRAAVRSRASALTETALAARARLESAKFSDRQDLGILTAAVRSLVELIGHRRSDFEAVRGPLGTSFMERAPDARRSSGRTTFTS